MSAHHRGERGLTLIEIVVVVAILAMIAGLLAPAVGNAMQDAKATKVLAVSDAVKKAAATHYNDTGTYAIEYSGSSYSAGQYHQLSLKQTTPGWEGPYMDHPLSSGDNPFGGFVYLYNNLTGGSAKPDGFDPTGAGSTTATGNGQFIGFGSIPENVAQLVDEAWDKNVPGDWKSSGRVEYSSANGGTLMLLLMYEQ